MQALFVMTTGPGEYCTGYLETVPLREPPEPRCQMIGEVYKVAVTAAGYALGLRIGTLMPGTELGEKPGSGQLTIWPAQGISAPYVAVAAALNPVEDFPEWYSGPWHNPRFATGGWLMLRRVACPVRYPQDELDDPELVQMLVQYLQAEMLSQRQVA